MPRKREERAGGGDGSGEQTSHGAREARGAQSNPSERVAGEMNSQRQAPESQWLDAVIENLTEGLGIVDGQGRVLRINRMGREMMGIPTQPPGEYGLLQDYFQRVDLRYPDGRSLPPEDWPPNRALRGETFSEMEVSLVRPDGVHLRLLFGGSPILDRTGNVTLAVNVWRDITALRELEERREEFIHLVAHDIRSPLTIIMGQAQLIARAAETGQKDRIIRGTDAIIVSGRRMNTMISDLVDSARLESGRLQLRKQTLNVNTFLADVLKRAAPLIDAARVRIAVPADFTPVVADADRLERILLNLLSNALKYSPVDTEVVVSAQTVNTEARISVTDQGVGIAPEDLPHIFDRFYRAGGARGIEGIGLGLYIVKMLLEAQGGQIWVESSLGKGSSFTFTLPLALEGRHGDSDRAERPSSGL